MIQYLSLLTFTHNHRMCLDHYLSMTETRLRISITNTRLPLIICTIKAISLYCVASKNTKK